MFKIDEIDNNDKILFYDRLNKQLEGLIAGEKDWLANISNAASLLYMLLKNINWAGFYLLKEGELVLGPFQGKPACIRIKLGKGVCGTAAKELETQVIEDVNQFPGHIACDAASQSEVVVPIVKNGVLIGVLDIDSPTKERFDKNDGAGLERFVEILNANVEWPKFD